MDLGKRLIEDLKYRDELIHNIGTDTLKLATEKIQGTTVIDMPNYDTPQMEGHIWRSVPFLERDLKEKLAIRNIVDDMVEQKIKKFARLPILFENIVWRFEAEGICIRVGIIFYPTLSFHIDYLGWS